MVWHAHMLNPRAFLEDAMLAGLRQLWNTGLPWAAINAAIDTKFNYNVSDDCKSNWTVRTGRSWESVDDPMFKSMQCPACNVPVQSPWTTCGLDETYKGDQRPGLIGNGYGDGNLLFKCPSCVVVIDKQLLAVSKFVKDTEALLARGRPLPGTVLDPISGMPEVVPGYSAKMFSRTFPNRMLQRVLRIEIVELILPGITPNPTMDTVRGKIEKVLISRSALRVIDGMSISMQPYRLAQSAKLAVRKMMAHYWENFTLFALDLGGAVLRQGVFVEKMVKIDWLHSPSAASTMSRLLTKYERFFAIMAANPKNTAVPTLDVDLAWHTHQLSPSNYYAYSISKTSKFIDHDDKIDEDKLSSSFEWTSKVYQDKYGEVYSECTCWYCETVRTTHVSSVGKMLGISKQEKMAENFHSSGAASLCPPDKSAHISSHNAVKSFQDPAIALKGHNRVQAQIAAVHRQRLDDAYAKAQKRAEKKGRKIPPKDQYYDHWGYPYYFYGPYMYPMWLTPGLYYGWAPGYVAACGAGGWASCAAGSCGGGVAAGACGGPGVSAILPVPGSLINTRLFANHDRDRDAAMPVVPEAAAALVDVVEEEEDAAAAAAVSSATNQQELIKHANIKSRLWRRRRRRLRWWWFLNKVSYCSILTWLFGMRNGYDTITWRLTTSRHCILSLLHNAHTLYTCSFPDTRFSFQN